MYIAVDPGIGGEFYVLACEHVTFNRAVKHNSGNPYVTLYSALGRKRKRMAAIIGSCDMPDNPSIDVQSAGEAHITGDRGLRTD